MCHLHNSLHLKFVGLHICKIDLHNSMREEICHKEFHMEVAVEIPIAVFSLGKFCIGIVSEATFPQIEEF